MKFTKKLGLVIAAAVICSGVFLTSIIAATDYSTEDPLISKSWVDNIFYPQIVQYVDSKIQEVKALISSDNKSDTSSVSDISYKVITLTKGQKLVCKEGSLEIILRPGGQAVVYSDIESNGVAELTGGTELLSGAAVPINAYCLIPRADGRGIICTSENAYVMVRGNYAVE